MEDEGVVSGFEVPIEIQTRLALHLGGMVGQHACAHLLVEGVAGGGAITGFWPLSASF